MKKTILLSALLGMIFLKAQTTIYSQAATGTDGMLSNALSDGTIFILADDFTLTSQSKITKVKIMGSQNAENLETAVATGAMLYIYADASGRPAGIPQVSGTPIMEVDIAKGAPGYNLIKTPNSNAYTFEIDINAALAAPVILSANTTYWLVFAAKTNLPDFDAPDFWFNWYVGQVNGNAAKAIDPSDLLGEGLTSWIDISSLMMSSAYDGLAFSIEGDISWLGTKEIYSSLKKVAVYPNPVSDYLTLVSEEKITAAEIFDSSGRKVPVDLKDNKVNVKNLTPGSYIINMETKAGRIAEKFIKY